MKEYFKTNLIFIIFFLSALTIFYNWWKTTKTLSTNDVMLQGLDILAGLVLTLSFVMMVYEHNKSNRREKNQRVLQLTLMNREYWLNLMELFMKHSDELKYLADEIFLGMEYEEDQIQKTPSQKQMEYYIIEMMFQMLVDVYRIYDINYLPKNDITGWSNTFVLIFSSTTVRKQWKHSRFLYGNSRVHDFIEEYGIIDKPKQKLLDEMRKSHMVTMIRNKKMTMNDFDKAPKHKYKFKDISKLENNDVYLYSKYTL